MPLLGGETCVGSDPSVQIPVRADMGLLPRHFAIAQLEGGWHLGAYEGAAVWVNGQPVRVTALHDGDRIVAGQLELTYRDEQEAAMAQARPTLTQAMPSLTQNSFQPLQTGPPRVLEESEPPAMARPMVAEPEDAQQPQPRMLIRTELGDVTSLAGGKRDHLLMILIGVVLIVIGGLFTKLAFFDKSGPLKQGDIIIKEGHITGVSVSGRRKGVRTTELLTDLGLTRMIQLPDDLPFNPVWTRPGSVAKMGFAKEEFNRVGTQVRLEVATLEVEGTTYRSLAKYNTSQEGQNQMFGMAAVGMVLGGFLTLMMGWEKWKTKRAGRR